MLFAVGGPAQTLTATLSRTSTSAVVVPFTLPIGVTCPSGSITVAAGTLVVRAACLAVLQKLTLCVVQGSVLISPGSASISGASITFAAATSSERALWPVLLICYRTDDIGFAGTVAAPSVSLKVVQQGARNV